MNRDKIIGIVAAIALLGGAIAWFAQEEDAPPVHAVRTDLPSLRAFKRELYPFYDGDDWGYMSRAGRQVIAPEYDGMDEFFDDVAAVKKNSKWGYLHSSGRFQSYSEYRLSRFSNGWGRASKVQGWVTAVLGHYERFTFVDLQGNHISSRWYDDAGDFSEGLARVNKGAGGFRQRVGGKWGYIDTAGREVIDLQFSQAGDFYDGLARVETGGKWGFIKPNGEFQISPRYEYAGDFSDGLAPVVVGRKYQYVDRGGVTKITGPFDIAYEFSEGKAVVVDNLTGPLRYIDREGKLAFKGTFEFAHAFSDGLARVGIHPSAGVYGFINHQGEWAIQPHFELITDFIDGYAYTTDGDPRFIDKQEKPLKFKP